MDSKYFYLFYKSSEFLVILSFACHFRFTFDSQLYSLFITVYDLTIEILNIKSGGITEWQANDRMTRMTRYLELLK